MNIKEGRFSNFEFDIPKTYKIEIQAPLAVAVSPRVLGAVNR